MDEIAHAFDPEGDVQLVLHNPNTPFVVWSEDEVPPATETRSEPAARGWEADWQTFGTPFRVIDAARESPVETAQTADFDDWDLTRPKKCKRSKRRTEEPPDFELAPAAPTAEEVTVLGRAIEDTLVTRSISREEQPEEPLPEPGPPPPPLPVEMRVSSRHLILASGFFKRALCDYREASLRTVEAEGWDVEALEIVLNIIHGRIGRVPRSLGLEQLAKVAVLVDYYKCHEVVELLSDMWIKKLRASVPRRYGRDLALWIFVAWVFGKADLFRTTTKVALRESRGPLHAPDLPILGEVADRIDRVRRESIHAVLALLDDLQVYLRDDRTTCSFACTSILLGALIKETRSKRVLSLRPTDPLTGYSVVAVLAAARAIHSPCWWDIVETNAQSTGWDSSYRYGSKRSHLCRIADFVVPNVDRLEERLEGLRLSDFRTSRCSR